MNKKLIGLAVAATLGLTTFAASAEDMYRGAWYAVPSIGYLNTDSDLDANNGAGAAIAIGKELSQSWDLQGRLGYNRANEDSDIPAVTGKYKQGTLGLDALYMFSRSNFRPFLLGGLGISRSGLTYKNEPSLSGVGRRKTSPLVGLGLGAQYLFNDNFGLQADLRHQWSKAIAPNNSRVVGSASSETVGNTLLNLGGVLRFGAPAPAVAEPAPEPAPVAMAEPEPEPAPMPEPEPAPMPEPTPEPVCTPKMDTITVGAEKLFGFDKSNLKAEGRAALDDAAAQIKANPEISVVIVTGHTDRLGSTAYNQALSQRRAKQVAEYLVSQGVEGSMIQAEGRGEAEPVVECSGNKATAKLISCLQPNRRVTIQAEGKKEAGCN